jgi:serine protease Do
MSELWESFAHPRGRLGVEVLPMTAELRESFGVEPDVGVLVTRAAPESPAAEAGIRAGDVIREADGKPIRTPRDLVHRVGHFPEGQELKLELTRKGEEKEIEVTLRGRALSPYGDVRDLLGSGMGKALHALRDQVRDLERRFESLEKRFEQE